MNKGSHSLYKNNSIKNPHIFLLPSETGREPFDISRHLSGPSLGPSVNLPYMTTLYLRHEGHTKPDNTTRDRYYKRLYRHLEKLAGQDLLEMEKGPDSLIWIAPNNRTFNLIREKHFSNFQENFVFPENNPITPHLKRQEEEPPALVCSRPRAHMRPERAEALKVARRDQILLEEDLGEIHDNYLDYRREIDNTVLLFKRREDLGNIDAEIKTSPYATRFNSLPRKIEQEKRYKILWNNATSMFQRGVFLTITTDPKRHRNVEEANKAFGPALNRFMTWIRKKVKSLGYGRVSYICANEFQKNGLLHAHIVIFGPRYLEHYRKVSHQWSRTGQGKIVYLYSLRKDGNGWYWVKQKPKDAEKGQSAGEYLKKYISKNLQDDGQDLYWLFGKRFFTNSKTLEEGPGRPPVPAGNWVYIGSCHWQEVPAEVESYNRRIRAGVGPPGPPPLALT